MTGPTTVSSLERVADLEAAGGLGERLDELVVDAPLGEHPGGRGADLAGVEAPTSR